MTRKTVAILAGSCLLILGTSLILPAQGNEEWTLIAWNDLGMHCMDADYAVFSILPPFNTIHAQLIDPSGALIENPGGISVTYEGLADPAGSKNTTSIGKTNFWDHVAALYGADPAPDEGLAGHDMPGAANVPQPMVWSSDQTWFSAEGIPITPYDDALAKNFYPVMRLVARNSAGNELAHTDVVLPVSDEMDCSACHASGSDDAAQPAGGWVFDPDPERDYRLNILLLHDETHRDDPAYDDALAQMGYDPEGLYPTVIEDSTPILCAACHGSNALPGTGVAGLSPLTRAVHALHATVIDPENGLPLDASENRTACYRCHPGSETRCLRGAMGKAVAPDGSLAMQCQDCHGSMSAVGAIDREGWLEQPACQSCHTGTAIDNNGQIRYTSVFDQNGDERQAVNRTFATNPDTPDQGLDLYRFSYGHGGLACQACHGSTHAIFPATHVNDNLQSDLIQGHEGTLVECSACHGTPPETVDGGPHGLHPIGPRWVMDHGDAAEDTGVTACRACHGSDYRGTVLSYSQADWSVTTVYGTHEFWRGFRIGCYACHNGPDDDDPVPNQPAVTADGSAETEEGVPVPVALEADDSDGDPLELRIVSQPAGGTVALAGSTATYYPFAGFYGEDTFTFAAWDGSTDSNLATVTVTVTNASIFADGFESGDLEAWSNAVP